jgi:hypothetical protein
VPPEKFRLTYAAGGTCADPARSGVRKFFAHVDGGTFVARLKLPSKILTHYGDLEKNFKFLKEVKILSEFFRSKLVCLIPIYVS